MAGPILNIRKNRSKNRYFWALGRPLGEESIRPFRYCLLGPLGAIIVQSIDSGIDSRIGIDVISLFIIIIIYSYCIELTVAMAKASTILQYSFG